MRWLPVFIACLGCIAVHAQTDPFLTVHQEQSAWYKPFEWFSDAQLDSLNGLEPSGSRLSSVPHATLNRIVFGYHPYWMGSTYLDYRWDLLSDLCYFSFEVDPYSGAPLTTHNWLNAPVIDSARANGVNVHLCITLFEAHMAFFGNAASRQMLIDTAIALVLARDAKGVNLDVEAVPSSLSSELNQFLIQFANAFHEQLPGRTVSLAVPGVDPYGTFNLQALEPIIDLFMIMGYDYYWNGSSTAGPVDPLHTMTGSSDHNLSQTVSYYQSGGIPNEKLVLGLPYYGRQWPVRDPLAPSPVNGWGTALTYSSIRNNGSGSYSWGNRRWEPNSLSLYYSFQSNGWNQCFINDAGSLGKRFDLVSQRGLAGIGIWALGYDHGYNDFWQLIQDKFTDMALPVYQDTIYDSGGPGFDYYAGEDYLIRIDHPGCNDLQLTFLEMDLEDKMDHLRIWDGRDTISPLLANLTGDDLPPVFTASQGAFTLRFTSDVAVNHAGWKAIWHCGPMKDNDPQTMPIELVKFCPDPVTGHLYLEIGTSDYRTMITETYDVTGKRLMHTFYERNGPGDIRLELDLHTAGIHAPGIYFTRIILDNGFSASFKWIFPGE